MTDALVGVLCALALRVAGALALAVGITGLITALHRARRGLDGGLVGRNLDVHVDGRPVLGHATARRVPLAGTRRAAAFGWS